MDWNLKKKKKKNFNWHFYECMRELVMTGKEKVLFAFGKEDTTPTKEKKKKWLLSSHNSVRINILLEKFAAK